MLRRPFASERIQRVDPRTGVRVIQLTAYPTPAAHMLYDWPCVTPDNGRVILICQRAASRQAPWDLFRVDADGLNLFQLTEYGDREEQGGYYGRPAARLTLDGRSVYVAWGDRLCRVDVETGETTELCSLAAQCGGSAIGRMFVSADGGRLFLTMTDRAGVIRVDVGSGTVDTVDLGEAYLFATDPTGPRLVVTKGTVIWDTETRQDGSRVVKNAGGLRAKWLVDEDGRDIQELGPEMYAHNTLLGSSLTVQGCGLPPDRCIWLVEPGQAPRKLAEGPYFWHSGASWSGEWIAADTNWPDEGLQLVHVPSGRFGRLCQTGATLEHYEFGHPHPTVSPDGRLVVFRSDRTGVPQIYIAHVTTELQERIKAGELDGRKWMGPCS